MDINFYPQTVITLVGVSHSGKSTFAKQVETHLKSLGRSVKILSSDSVRKELLGLGEDDPISVSSNFGISGITFEKLFNDLKIYTSSPVNTDVVIVDTTGLDRKFREQVASVAKDAGYSNIAVMFELSSNTLESRYTGDNFGYIVNQLTRMREKVLPKFNKHDYMQTYRITEKIKDNIVLKDFIDNSKVLTITEGVWSLYGDVHQCHDEFLELYLNNSEKNPRSRHLLLGDWIDKGDKESLFETLDLLNELVFDQVEPVQLLRGNHEEYVYRHLTNPDYVFERNEETAYFTSLEYLCDPVNEAYADIFKKLFEASYEFAEMRSDRFWGIASHSPCEAKYLGKRSPKALKMQRNTRLIKGNDRTVSALANMNYILKERLPIKHIFGHVEVGKNFNSYNGHIAIDQGVCSGGHLTSCTIDMHTGHLDLNHIESKKPRTDALEDFSLHIKPWTNVKELDPVLDKAFKRLVRANPAFISGTVSPSPAFIDNDGVPQLETVESAINYYLKHGVDKVVAQTKYMGSRCQIYLTEELKDCYATSRSGYKIADAKVETIIKELYEYFKDTYSDLLILDGELLPWSAMGRGLIDNSFNGYYQANKNELDMLRGSPILQYIPELDVEIQLENLEKFDKQVKIYGAEAEQNSYAIFGVIYKDGTEYLTKNLATTLGSFGIGHSVFDINTQEGKDALQAFYDQQVSNGTTEGIAIKPLVWEQGIAPMLKVRNSEYLRLVYGYDYTDYLEKHCREKDIRGKLHLSMREQELNLHLLKAYKNGNIADQQDIYKLLLVEFSKESSLDPRL